MRRNGFEVTTFEEVDAFIVAAKASAPACIIVDAHTAERPAEILKELGGRTYSAPIVMISGRVDVSTVVEIFKRGAVGVIEKPIRPASMVRRLRDAIDTWMSRRG